MADREEYLSALMGRDPGLPCSNPTKAFWQDVPHPLSAAQSSTLSPTVDIAIIGSGITGASVTKAILEADPTKQVTVFEARTLCSGATGRNGGQLAINAAETYLTLKKQFGSDMAGRIIQFNIQTLDRLREVAHEIKATEYIELTEVEKIRSFKDEKVWKGAKDGVEALKEDHPSLGALYRLLSADDCAKEYSGAIAGAIVHPSGTVWPYRLVTSIFENLRERFSSRLSIETNTPITEIDYDIAGDSNFPYVLRTPRGVVRAAQLAHCTNAYTSHLLTELRGVIFPLKGTMTVQDLGSERPNQGSNTSWAIHYTPFEDDQEESVADGLIYGMQNVNTGAFFFGGEKAPVSDMISADDGKLSSTSVKFQRHSLLSIFGEDGNTRKGYRLVSSWSGIMGFTSDGMPLVGSVPGSITHRPGENEWICAGFNGYGMPIAWLAGENLAKMMLGGQPDSQFPDAFLLSQERIQERLSLRESVRNFASLES